MRYRALDADGDMTFGFGQANMLINSPEAVGQSILTRLRLWQGEWFRNIEDGTPYMTEVLGEHTQQLYDIAIRERIISTQGVLELLAYGSSVADRALTVRAIVSTVYGELTFSETL